MRLLLHLDLIAPSARGGDLERRWRQEVDIELPPTHPPPPRHTENLNLPHPYVFSVAALCVLAASVTQLHPRTVSLLSYLRSYVSHFRALLFAAWGGASRRLRRTASQSHPSGR